MAHMNGLKTAEQIRRMDSEVAIIFLTTLNRYGLEGYKYQAMNNHRCLGYEYTIRLSTW